MARMTRDPLVGTGMVCCGKTRVEGGAWCSVGKCATRCYADELMNHVTLKPLTCTRHDPSVHQDHGHINLGRSNSRPTNHLPAKHEVLIYRLSLRISTTRIKILKKQTSRELAV
jgi:hypothetical protein